MGVTSNGSLKDEVRRRIGRVGVWIGGPAFTAVPAEVEHRALARVEALGAYGSIWTGETPGRKEAFAHLALWLGATEGVAVGSGIANVWARQPEAMQGGAATLAEAHPGRFILGVGVGHRIQADQVGGDYGRPLDTFTRYLDRMDAEAEQSTVPAPPFARVVGAVGPRMLELAAERTEGAHPYFVPVEHTADARRRMGPEALLIPEQSFLVDPSPETRAAYRQRLALGVSVPAYAANLRRFGFTDDDLTSPSDRLADAISVAGSPEMVVARIQAHLDAGADHVLVAPFADDLTTTVDQLERLAPALATLR